MTLLASLRAMVLPKTCGLPWRWNFKAQRSLDSACWHWDSIPSRCSMVIPCRSIGGKFQQWFVSWRLLGIIWPKSSRSRLWSILSLTHENKWSSTWHTMRAFKMLEDLSHHLKLEAERHVAQGHSSTFFARHGQCQAFKAKLKSHETAP